MKNSKCCLSLFLFVVSVLSIAFPAQVFAYTIHDVPFSITSNDTKSSTKHSDSAEPILAMEEDYYKISSVELVEHEVVDMLIFDNDSKVDEGVRNYLSEAIAVTESLIAVGKKVYELVKKGRPVVQTDLGNTVSVIPKFKTEDEAFAGMTNWAPPKAKEFELVYKNKLGMTVVTFNYVVSFQYGGKYEDKGNYLLGIGVTPGYVHVKWGFDLDAKSVLKDISNLGTKDNPIAGATIEIFHEVSNIINSTQATQKIFFDGTGKITFLN